MSGRIEKWKHDKAISKHRGESVRAYEERAAQERKKFDSKESGIKDASDEELRKGIQSLKDRITQHNEKISNPEKYIDGWDVMSAEKQDGTKKHWQKEIKNFNDSIFRRERELRKRSKP